MYERGDAGNILLEYAEGVGIGEHHRRHGVVKQRFEVGDIHCAILAALHLHHLQAADGGGSGVGAVGRIRDNHLAAFVTFSTRCVVGANHHQSGQLTLCACEWVEGELLHPSYLTERFLQGPVHLQRTLRGERGCRRMQSGETTVGCHLLVDFRIVFHRA